MRSCGARNSQRLGCMAEGSSYSVFISPERGTRESVPGKHSGPYPALTSLCRQAGDGAMVLVQPCPCPSCQLMGGGVTAGSGYGHVIAGGVCYPETHMMEREVVRHASSPWVFGRDHCMMGSEGSPKASTPGAWRSGKPGLSQ